MTAQGARNLEETEQGDLEVTLYDSDNLDDLEESRNNLVDLRDNLKNSRDHTEGMILPQDPSATCASDRPKGGKNKGTIEDSKLQREKSIVAVKTR